MMVGLAKVAIEEEEEKSLLMSEWEMDDFGVFLSDKIAEFLGEWAVSTLCLDAGYILLFRLFVSQFTWHFSNFECETANMNEESNELNGG